MTGFHVIEKATGKTVDADDVPNEHLITPLYSGKRSWFFCEDGYLIIEDGCGNGSGIKDGFYEVVWHQDGEIVG